MKLSNFVTNLFFVLGLAFTAQAQWIKLPLPGTPRTKDGKPNLSAPAPRASDGHPDSAEVGMAVGSARRGSAEIRLAIFGARRTRQRQFDPLGLRSEGQTQDEEKVRDEVREFH